MRPLSFLRQSTAFEKRSFQPPPERYRPEMIFVWFGGTIVFIGCFGLLTWAAVGW